MLVWEWLSWMPMPKNFGDEIEPCCSRQRLLECVFSEERLLEALSLWMRHYVVTLLGRALFDLLLQTRLHA